MKRIISGLLAIILVVGMIPMINVTASATDEYTDGNYRYKVENDSAIIVGLIEGISGDVVIPSKLGGYTVTGIGDRAFYFHESGVTTIEIGESITSIGEYVFSNCTSLTNITVDENNQYYCSSDGVLFNKDKTELIRYPGNSTAETYEIPTGVVTIRAGAFHDCRSLTTVIIPDSVKIICDETFKSCRYLSSITIPNSVTKIGVRAFSYCHGIETMEIPDSVEEIGDYAFESAVNLTSITLSNSIDEISGRLFADCRSLASITIPDSVKKIGVKAFSGCHSLESITIPESVRELGSGVFYNCTNLKSANIPNGVETIEGLFESCSKLETVEIPDSVKTIGAKAFSYCKSLTEITIPASVEKINSFAFDSCEGLKKVNYTGSLNQWASIEFGIQRANPTGYSKNLYINNELVTEFALQDGLEAISDCAFYECDSLVSVKIPDTVKTIGSNAFYGCDSLASLDLGSGVEKIDNSAFSFCVSLTSLVVPGSLKETGVWVFSGCSGLNSVTISNGVKNIASIMFSECTSLETVSLPDSLISIDSSAFSYCTSLKSMTLPDNIETIGMSAFLGCTALETITIPESINFIEVNAFYNCASLGVVNYTGTQEEWNSIKIKDCNYPLESAVINYNYGHTVIVDEAVASTCTETGLTEGSHCSECGKVIVTPNIVAAAEHTYKNGECTVCGKWQYKDTAVTLKSVKNTTSGVNITWSKLAGADKYAVYRKTTGGWTKLTASATGTSYTDKTAKNNVKYTYTVRAINGTEYNTKYNKTGLSVTFMSAPKITKIANATNGVTVTWGKVSGATSYNVYRKTTGGWTKLGSTKSTSFTDTKAKAGTKYTYTIIAVKKGANNSSYYGGKAIVRLTVPKLTKLTATSKKNTLTYGKVTGATSYIIYRKTGNGGWQRIATTKSTKYVDTKVKKGTYYTYTVKAVKGSSTSYYNTKGLKVRAK